MADEPQSESDDSQPTDGIEAEASYTIPARRVTWLRIYLLVLLAVATATLAVLFSGDPGGRPLWLILLAVAIAVGCLLLTYALGKAVIRPARPLRQAQSQQPPLLA